MGKPKPNVPSLELGSHISGGVGPGPDCGRFLGGSWAPRFLEAGGLQRNFEGFFCRLTSKPLEAACSGPGMMLEARRQTFEVEIDGVTVKANRK